MSKLIGALLNLTMPPVIDGAIPDGFNCVDPFRALGLELEIEHVKNPIRNTQTGFVVTNDGSLRNDGKEFVSVPSTFGALITSTKALMELFKFSEANYSERCSVHVHVNCQDLTPDTLAGVCLLYQVFEYVLFHYAGGDRKSNIFCVPWAETNITYNTIARYFEEKNPTLLRQWQKYTALNLLPLSTQGTVEFRHLPGTCDVNTIANWINLILSLFVYAGKTSLVEIKTQLIELNTNSHYLVLLDSVFGEYAHLLKYKEVVQDMEDGVLAFKYAFTKDYPSTHKRIPRNPRVNPFQAVPVQPQPPQEPNPALEPWPAWQPVFDIAQEPQRANTAAARWPANAGRGFAEPAFPRVGEERLITHEEFERLVNNGGL